MTQAAEFLGVVIPFMILGVLAVGVASVDGLVKGRWFLGVLGVIFIAIVIAAYAKQEI